jgi:hypothetical protein
MSFYDLAVALNPRPLVAPLLSAAMPGLSTAKPPFGKRMVHLPESWTTSGPTKILK